MDKHPEIVVIGSLVADLVQSVDRLPKPGETILGGTLNTFSGGKGANQACAAAQMGARVRMIGRVGRDNLGSFLLESLQAAGVNTESVSTSDRSTGTGVIFVLPDGENLIVVSPGANTTTTPEIAAEKLQILEENTYLLAQLEIPIESVGKSLAIAKACGATSILDPAPAHQLAPELMRNVDFLTPNETETVALLGAPGLSMDDEAEIELAASRLLAFGSRTVILKLGCRGCMIATEGSRYRVPGFRVKTVDTTAAGDVFNGALATALAEGQTVPQAARFANAAAALSVTLPGAQSSIPSRLEVNQFLSENAP